MLNTKKNAKSLQVNDAATLSHETATIQIPLKLKFLMEDYPNLLDVIFEMYSFNNDFSTMARSLREIIFEPMMSANNIQNYADYQTQYQDLIVLHNCFEDLEKKAAKP